MKSSDLFLAEVKTSHFAVSNSRMAFGDERRGGFLKVRELVRVENEKPDEVFTVIGVKNMQVGKSKYISSDEGYAWYGKGEQVVIIARSIGRRFTALISDLQILSDKG